jgi:CheY-like chemotaxis protein
VNLTTQLLTFSKGGKPAKKPVALRPLIENSVKFALSGSRVYYRMKMEDGLWMVDADEGQLGQVIQNIVLNADQAMPLGGLVTIAARNVRAPGKGAVPFLKEGSYVAISIKDSGIGIPAKYLEKIFDPYFTTKDKGSGLGLATSYSIVRNHGGIIDVASEVGKGTMFVVYLPAIEAVPEAPKALAASPSLPHGRVLVMDDEPVVRSIAGELLHALGQEADFAATGEEAIEKYAAARASGRPFDAVILDLTVRGGLGGRETMERLRALDPNIKGIVSSGYSDDAVVADHEAFGFRARLTKPYRLEDLKAVLSSLPA